MKMQHMNHPMDDALMGDSQVKRLVEKHDRLELQLQEAQKGPIVDWDGVKLIKRQKVAINDEIEKLRRTLH